jgi:hypothetical protein
MRQFSTLSTEKTKADEGIERYAARQLMISFSCS